MAWMSFRSTLLAGVTLMGMMLVITVDGEIFKSAIFLVGSFGALLRECISNKQVTYAHSMFVLQQSIYYSLQGRV